MWWCPEFLVGWILMIWCRKISQDAAFSHSSHSQILAFAVLTLEPWLKVCLKQMANPSFSAQVLLIFLAWFLKTLSNISNLQPLTCPPIGFDAAKTWVITDLWMKTQHGWIKWQIMSTNIISFPGGTHFIQRHCLFPLWVPVRIQWTFSHRRFSDYSDESSLLAACT